MDSNIPPDVVVALTPESEINWDDFSLLADLSDTECSAHRELPESHAHEQPEDRPDCQADSVESGGEDPLWALEQTAWHNMWNLHQLRASCPAKFELTCSVPEDDPFHTDWSEVCAP
mmetsp:Transcript_71200/g.190082  ORF Transcript_71200/g.190082 Transcript_71200/m.190082 type:complete len:117 (-) Transcript_71200:74-424(-)